MNHLKFPINTKVQVQRTNKDRLHPNSDMPIIKKRSIRVDKPKSRIEGDHNFQKPRRGNEEQFRRNRHNQLMKVDIQYKLADTEWLDDLHALKADRIGVGMDAETYREEMVELHDRKPDPMTWGKVVVKAEAKKFKVSTAEEKASLSEAYMCLDFVKSAR